MSSSRNNLGDVIERTSPASLWLIEVRSDGSERRLTFAEFHETADAVARGLLKRGLRRGERIGILGVNCAEYLLAFFGIMRAGLCAVPINYKLAPDTLAHIVKDAALRLVLADGDRAALVDGVPTLRFDTAEGWRGLTDPGPFEPETMRDDEFATILYTSGSTGRPKGVPLTHGGYVWTVAVLNASGPPVRGKRMLVAAPLFHMNGLLQSTLMGAAGGTVVLLDRFSPVAYLETAAAHHCEVLTSVPTMLALLARETATIARLDFSGVELVLTGSGPSTEALFARVAEIFPKAKVLNGWGTTESSPVAFGRHPAGLPRPPLSIGYPMPEAELKLVGGGADDGVLWVRNRAIMPGYLNLPEDTAKRMHDGWYDTGDVMRRDAQGFYYFVGRADDMFSSGGENIYPGEVEKLLERHPAVAQAAVVPIDDQLKHQVPVAFVVAKPGSTPNEDEIKQFALANGPAYLHPRFVEFVAELPLAGTNKVDRQALIARAASLFRR